jgi:ATP-dependent DNA helicase RecG
MSKIKQWIKKGEGKTIEFKRTLPDGNHIAKTVIAFSNMAGGKIIIGIEDKTAGVIGINDDEAMDFPDKISNIIHERCHPFILPEIYLVYINDAKVLVIEVFPGALKPYYLKNKGKRDGTYIRVGATNKKADMEMIMELERQKRNISFDEELDYELDEKNLDMERLKTDFHRYTGRSLDYNRLLNLKILVEEHGKIYPTVGGLLLAGKIDYMEYARIKCARFKGTNMDIFIDQKEFTGPIYRQVEEAMKFAHTYIALSGKVEGLQRIDRYEVPLEVIREAIVNAVVHRDYSISGSDIKFAIFDDRIEVTSPGALPRSLEIEDIIAGRSEIRNKVIARFFKEIEFIEQWGNGIKKMFRLLQLDGLPGPQFRESGLFFKVIFYKKKKQETTIETAETSGETTAKDSRNTTAKIRTDTKKENINNDFGDKKTTTKTMVETTAKTSGEMVEDKRTTIETTETAETSGETTAETTGKDSEKTTTKTEAAVIKDLIDDNFKNKKATTKVAIETTAKTSIMLIELIKKKPNAGLNELAEYLQLTRDGVRYHLKNLKQKGVLKRIGSSREGYWKINEDRKPKSTT